MDDTLKIIVRGDTYRSSFPRSFLAPPSGAPPGGSRGALSWTCAFPGIGSLAIFSPRGDPPSNPDWPSLPVAYSLQRHSRLGYSPKLVFDRAYHSTSCKSQSNTNQCLGKKTGGFPASRPLSPLICFVAQRQRHFLRPGKRWRITALELVILSAFIIAPIQKRSKYMSNLIFPLPPPVMSPPQPLSQPCGALAVQPCVAPIPGVPLAPTPCAAPQPKIPISAAPAPLPSARCSVKGCVFPTPSRGSAICHYHELLQSEAELFQSHQPSHLLSLHAPFGIPDNEPDDSRQQDRKRQAAEREAFILDDVV